MSDAPRVTIEQIESKIVSEHYFTARDGIEGARGYDAWSKSRESDSWDIPPLKHLTLCVLVLHTGYTIVGKSACVSAANFDAELGRKYAREDAIRQMWPLEGYLLSEKLHGRE